MEYGYTPMTGDEAEREAIRYFERDNLKAFIGAVRRCPDDMIEQVLMFGTFRLFGEESLIQAVQDNPIKLEAVIRHKRLREEEEKARIEEELVDRKLSHEQWVSSVQSSIMQSFSDYGSMLSEINTKE